MRNAVWPATALLLAVFALALTGGAIRQHALAGGAATLTVTKVEDTNNLTCATGDCSLREALNNLQPQDHIDFDIEGGGPHTIVLNDALPPILQPNNGVIIDGYSQPGSQGNSAPAFGPDNAIINIVIDGHLLPNSSSGLWIGATNVTIQGLSIVNFGGEGIKVATFGTANIQGNFIGVLPDGITAGPNGNGISMRSSQAGNSIGGALTSQLNLISGNTGAGISVMGSTPIEIAGNFIGTDKTGMQALPNGGNGIDMAGGTTSTIGGSRLSGGNLISGNAINGIAISTPDGAHMNIKGNYIGIAADNQTPLPNGHDGVFLSQGAVDNTIGGEFNVDEQNTIAYNTAAGVGIAASAGVDNYVDPNALYSNGGLGVDILDDGAVLPNDPGDGDGGDDGSSPPYANHLMNYPVITSATYDGSHLIIHGMLDTVPNSGYHNMFFLWNDSCDPSGYGEGQHFLGSLGFDPGRGPTFDRTFAVALSGDIYLVMSASDPESSSEFSACYLLQTDVASPTPSASPIPTPTASPTPTPSPMPTLSPSPTPTTPAQVKQGDINCDDTLTIADVTQFLNYLGTNERGPAPVGCPDVGTPIGSDKFLDADCDGLIGARDLLVMLIYLSGANQLDLRSGCPAVGDRLS